jgi:sorting nexin-4
LDRFTDEFVEKRKVSLERFLNRLLQHPLISQSQYLKRFIYEELWFVSMAPSEKEGVLESVSESWMNAFSKVKKPDERFLEIQNTTTIYEENLKTVEKNVSKLAKLHDELGQDLQGLSAEMGDIGALEAGVTDRLQQFSNALNALGEFSKNCVCLYYFVLFSDNLCIDSAPKMRRMF